MVVQEPELFASHLERLLYQQSNNVVAFEVQSSIWVDIPASAMLGWREATTMLTATAVRFLCNMLPH